jgi:hypothetical protein
VKAGKFRAYNLSTGGVRLLAEEVLNTVTITSVTITTSPEHHKYHSVTP